MLNLVSDVLEDDELDDEDEEAGEVDDESGDDWVDDAVEEDAVEVVIEEDDGAVQESVEHDAADDGTGVARDPEAKFQSSALKNRLRLLQHCELSPAQQ